MMRHTLALSAAALAAIILTAPAAQAADLALGKKLYSENCVKCHGAEKYARPDRKVHSMSNLKTYVQGCATNLSLSWFEDEVDAVTAYMNKEFYKFK
ncbi:MAG: c-type cytochrome [Halothiobacillaceae bacterium]